LEDHLEYRATRVGGLVDRADVRRDSGPFPSDGLTDMDDHVELGRAVGHDLPGFDYLDCGSVPAVVSADGGAHGYSRGRENPRDQTYRVGLDADARHAVAGGQPASFLELRAALQRPEQRVVDSPGNRLVRQCECHDWAGPSVRSGDRE